MFHKIYTLLWDNIAYGYAHGVNDGGGQHTNSQPFVLWIFELSRIPQGSCETAISWAEATDGVFCHFIIALNLNLEVSLTRVSTNCIWHDIPAASFIVNLFWFVSHVCGTVRFIQWAIANIRSVPGNLCVYKTQFRFMMIGWCALHCWLFDWVDIRWFLLHNKTKHNAIMRSRNAEC